MINIDSIQDCYENNNAISLKKLLNANEFLNSKERLSFIVGEDKTHKVLIDNLKTCESIFVVGMTCSGKTVFLNQIIISLLFKDISKIKFEFVDPKFVELREFDNVPNSSRVCTMEDIKLKLEEIKCEIEQREKGKEFSEDILLIIDEIGDMLFYDKDSFLKLYTYIVQHGPKVSVYPIFTTQAISIGHMSKEFVNLFKTKVVFRLCNEEEYKFMDVSGVGTFDFHGEMVYCKEDYIKELRAGFITDKDIKNVVDSIK